MLQTALLLEDVAMKRSHDGARWAKRSLNLAAMAATAWALMACGGGGDSTDSALASPLASPSLAARQALASTRAPMALTGAQSVTVEALLDWAEKAYPQHFPGHQVSQVSAPYIYRHYVINGVHNYVGVDGDKVAILGPQLSGGVLQQVGRLADFSCQVHVDNCPVSLRGTAAVGRPLSGATVTVRDAAGRVLSAVTDASGAYSIDDIRSLAWPVVAKVSGGVQGCVSGTGCTAVANLAEYLGTVVGDKAGTNVLNLTPLTHAVILAAASVDAATLFGDASTWSALTPARLDAAVANLKSWLKRLNPQLSLPTALDVLSGAFVPLPSDAHEALLEAVNTLLAALQLDVTKLAQLVGAPSTTANPPVALFCDVAGRYQGTYAGSTSGNWTATIDSRTGLLVGMANDTAGFSTPGLGSVSRVGVGDTRTSAVMGLAGVASFNGSVSATLAFTGTWSSPIEKGGSFTGTRVSPASGCH